MNVETASEPLEKTSTSEVRRTAISLGRFLLAATVLWIVLYWLWTTFPYVRNGTDIIIDAKLQDIRDGKIIPKDVEAKYRVVFFGHSKVLCGFKPNQFAELSDGSVYSYNLGLPGKTEFVFKLERMAKAGDIPTHVFLLLAWPGKAFQPSIWKWYESDKPIIDAAFPFRKFPRDLFVFAYRARQSGGLEAFYDYGRQSVLQMERDHGYYFIEGGALFANFRLPDAYAFPKDDLKRIVARPVEASGPYFERLKTLAEKYGFSYYLVPSYHRDLACAAAPPQNEEVVRALEGHPHFHLVGPDYYRYPNRDFSDHAHLNREGAERYTADLWNETRHLFE